MKILFVIENFKLGGKQRRFIELLKGINNEESIEYHVLILSNEIHYNEIYSIARNLTILERRRKKDWTLFLKIRKISKEIKPDIIHTWGSMSTVYVLPSIWFSRVKLVNSMIIHATPLSILHEDWARAKLTFPFSHKIIANSFAGLKAFKVKSKGEVVHNGFDFKRVERLSSSKEVLYKFNIQTDKVVGMVGAFEARKDYGLFIDAAIEIVKQRDDVSFLAVGDGKTLAKIKEKVQPEFFSRIIFTGKQKNIESLINIFTIGVLTTNNLIHGEGISNSILEYMALAKPVVATKGGGTSEILQDNKTGYLVEPSNITDLASRIIELLENPDKVKRMGEIGGERIKQDFNLNKMTAEYINIYKKLLT